MKEKSKFKVKKGDLVQVISGKDKGKRGKVSAVYPGRDRLVVAGVHQAVRHVKPSQKNPHGGILNKETPIHVSNVMLVDPKTGTPTRTGMKEVDGKRVRFAKKSGTVLREEK